MPGHQQQPLPTPVGQSLTFKRNSGINNRRSRKLLPTPCPTCGLLAWGFLRHSVSKLVLHRLRHLSLALPLLVFAKTSELPLVKRICCTRCATSPTSSILGDRSPSLFEAGEHSALEPDTPTCPEITSGVELPPRSFGCSRGVSHHAFKDLYF